MSYPSRHAHFQIFSISYNIRADNVARKHSTSANATRDKSRVLVAGVRHAYPLERHNLEAGVEPVN